ncbi:MAG: hypothetical protein K0S71_2825 [Clostridia bacterium]|jgi:hypothetical protein|nr:hypothetical protein [Clostridia bacterium]
MLNNTLVISAIFAHFLGDFVFQTNKIAVLKSRNIQGVSVHIAVTGIIHFIILASFGLKGLTLTAAILVLHFFVDLMKLKLKHIRIPTTYFFIDQAMHLSIIIYLSKHISAASPIITLQTIYYFKLTILFIICTYVATIVIKQLYFSFGILSYEDHSFFDSKERELDGLFNACLLGIMHFRPYLSIGYVLTTILIYFVLHRKAVRLEDRWLYLKGLFYTFWVIGWHQLYLLL